MTLPVFVVDTNVVVAGLITGSVDSPVAAALDAMLGGSLVYLLSADLLNEYRAVISRPEIRKLHHLNEAQINRLLVELTANAMWREPKSGSRAPDPGDDHLWALLEAHDGSILISGDQLVLKTPPDNRSVITPKTWFDRFLHGDKRSG